MFVESGATARFGFTFLRTNLLIGGIAGGIALNFLGDFRDIVSRSFGGRGINWLAVFGGDGLVLERDD